MRTKKECAFQARAAIKDIVKLEEGGYAYLLKNEVGVYNESALESIIEEKHEILAHWQVNKCVSQNKNPAQSEIKIELIHKIGKALHPEERVLCFKKETDEELEQICRTIRENSAAAFADVEFTNDNEDAWDALKRYILSL